MNIISFDKKFRKPGQKYLGTAVQGEEDYPKLEKFIKEFPDGQVVVFDISGFELFGYSYSKQTIRAAHLANKAGLFGSRFLLVKAPDKEYASELAGALTEESVVMICSYATGSGEFYNDYSLLGEINEVQRQTLDHIIKKKELISSDLMNDLKIQTISAASNRLSRLKDERLIRWEDSGVHKGNVFQCRRIDP
jgi:hypothetical protein